MAGLGLNQAVDAYTQGVKQGEQIRQIEQARKEDEAVQAADQAYGAVHQRAQERLLAANPTATYTPDDATEFEAAEARGAELAKRGLWKHYLTNEAMVQQQRVRVRSDALNQYKVDGDPEKLVRTVYPTIFNGKKVVSVKRMEGAPAGLGFEAIPDKVEIELDDGTKSTRPVAELVADLNKSLVDPAKFAEQEVRHNFLMAQIKARGEENRGTEKVKADGRIAVEEKRGQVRLDVENVRLGGRREQMASNEKIAETRAGATVGAAGIRAGATVGAATIRAEGTKEAANTRANAPPKPGKAPDPAKAFDSLHKEVTKIIGDNTQNLFGGVRVPTEDTLRIARVAEQAKKAGVDHGTAIQEAIRAYKREQEKKAPKK